MRRVSSCQFSGHLTRITANMTSCADNAFVLLDCGSSGLMISLF